MAPIAPTLAASTEFSGDYKILKLTSTLTTASDTVVLTKATHGVDEILFVFAKLTAGYDDHLSNIFATYTGLTITITSTLPAGTAADDWTGATFELLVIGRNIT